LFFNDNPQVMHIMTTLSNLLRPPLIERVCNTLGGYTNLRKLLATVGDEVSAVCAKGALKIIRSNIDLYYNEIN